MGWTGPLHWTLSPTLSMRFWLTSDICEVCFFGEQVSVTASPLNRCWFRVLNCMLNSFVFIYMCLFHGWTSKPTGFIMLCKAQTVEIKPGFFHKQKSQRTYLLCDGSSWVSSRKHSSANISFYKTIPTRVLEKTLCCVAHVLCWNPLVSIKFGAACLEINFVTWLAFPLVHLATKSQKKLGAAA
jgi:hypothetical protein